MGLKIIRRLEQLALLRVFLSQGHLAVLHVLTHKNRYLSVATGRLGIGARTQYMLVRWVCAFDFLYLLQSFAVCKRAHRCFYWSLQVVMGAFSQLRVEFWG